MRDDPSGIYLVTRAQTGDQQAWDLLVERYAPLVWSICRRYRLGGPGAEDVSQNVWLRLVDQLDRIRDPAALPGWLATTTSRECAKALRAARGPHAAGQPLEAENIPDAKAATAEQDQRGADKAEIDAGVARAQGQLLPGGEERVAARLGADPAIQCAQPLQERAAGGEEQRRQRA